MRARCRRLLPVHLQLGALAGGAVASLPVRRLHERPLEHHVLAGLRAPAPEEVQQEHAGQLPRPHHCLGQRRRYRRPADRWCCLRHEQLRAPHDHHRPLHDDCRALHVPAGRSRPREGHPRASECPGGSAGGGGGGGGDLHAHPSQPAGHGGQELCDADLRERGRPGHGPRPLGRIPGVSVTAWWRHWHQVLLGCWRSPCGFSTQEYQDRRRRPWESTTVADHGRRREVSHAPGGHIPSLRARALLDVVVHTACGLCSHARPSRANVACLWKRPLS
mmetsp:Transcript_50550/g.135204  ORF Transcript_50550/g.135204 Transcript_50550/m.135204 type:complete len:276 (-) Transcript_50550:19-846(-)